MLADTGKASQRATSAGTSGRVLREGAGAVARAPLEDVLRVVCECLQ